MAMKRVGPGANSLTRINATEMEDGQIAITNSGKYIMYIKDHLFLVLDSNESPDRPYDYYLSNYNQTVSLLPSDKKIAIEFFNK